MVDCNARAKWTLNATNDLILYVDEIKLVERMDLKNMRKSVSFDSVILKMQSKGYNFTKSQIKNKWKKLKETYRELCDELNKSGAAPKKAWPYFDAMNRIFTSQPRSVACASGDAECISMESEPLTPATEECFNACEIPFSSELLPPPLNQDEKAGPSGMTNDIFILSIGTDAEAPDGNKAIENEHQLATVSGQSGRTKRRHSLTAKEEGKKLDKLCKLLAEEGEKDRALIVQENKKMMKCISEENEKFIDAIRAFKSADSTIFKCKHCSNIPEDENVVSTSGKKSRKLKQNPRIKEIDTTCTAKPPPIIYIKEELET